MRVDEGVGSSHVKKKIIYLDQFTLSHMASSQDARFSALPALAAYKELYSLAREAVRRNLVVFPRSQTHIDEIDLAEHSADALTTVSHTLSWGIGFKLPRDFESTNCCVTRTPTSTTSPSRLGTGKRRSTQTRRRLRRR